MGPGFGKGRVHFKYSLAGLGALQGEQVEGSMVFWCGASGSLRIAGRRLTGRNPPMPTAGGDAAGRGLVVFVELAVKARPGACRACLLFHPVPGRFCLRLLLAAQCLVLRRRPDAVGPRPCPGGVDGLHPVDVANARRHVGAGVDGHCAVGVRLLRHIGVAPWR